MARQPCRIRRPHPRCRAGLARGRRGRGRGPLAPCPRSIPGSARSSARASGLGAGPRQCRASRRGCRGVSRAVAPSPRVPAGRGGGARAPRSRGPRRRPGRADACPAGGARRAARGGGNSRGRAQRGRASARGEALHGRGPARPSRGHGRLAASQSRRRRAPRRQPGPRPRPCRQARPLDPRLREDPAEEESRGRHRPARPARRRRAQERRGTGGVAAQGAAPGSGERAQVGGARLRQAGPELSGKRRGFGRDLAARLALLAARRLWRGDRAVESYRLGPGGQPGIPRRFCVLDRPRPRGARPDRGRDPAVRSAHRGGAAQLLRDPCLPPGAARPAEPWPQSRLRPARGIAARGPSRAAPGRGAVGPRRGAAGGGARRLRRRRDGFHGATGGR